MKLYDFGLAYNPGKVRLALIEKGLQFQTQPIDLLNGQSLNPDFLRINPSGTLPVLEDGDRKLVETLEIVEYVDSKGERLGGDNVDRQLVEHWVKFLNNWDGNLFVSGSISGAPKKILGAIEAYRLKYAEARKKENPDMAAVYDAKIAAMKASNARGEDLEAIKANKQQLSELLDEAEVQLGKTPFLAGSAYSLADVMFTAVLQRITSTGGSGAESKYITPRAKVSAYYNNAKARPSYKQAYDASSSPVLGAFGKAMVSRLTGWY